MFQYRQAVARAGLRKNCSTRSFQAFGFGAKKDISSSSLPPHAAPQQWGTDGDTSHDTLSHSGMTSLPRRGSHINVNVAPTIMDNDTPEIRKYKKRFNADILCAALWGEFLEFRPWCCLMVSSLVPSDQELSFLIAPFIKG